MVYIKNTKFNLFSNNTIKQALNEQKLKKIENLCNSEKKSENNKNKSNPKLTLISSSNNNSICTSEILGDKKNQNKGGNQRSRNKNMAKLSQSV